MANTACASEPLTKRARVDPKDDEPPRKWLPPKDGWGLYLTKPMMVDKTQFENPDEATTFYRKFERWWWHTVTEEFLDIRDEEYEALEQMLGSESKQSVSLTNDLVEMTLYAPMRDGAAETTMIGLFSDWRDVAFGVDKELGTVIGTFLQIDYMVQHRKWTPFNAIRKPERTIVNMQPIDMEDRSHFLHAGENLWRGGDKFMNGSPQRGDNMEKGRQPLTINIEQQDKTTWWILIDCGNTERPPEWTRRFSAAIRRTLHDFMFDPLALVHRPFPPGYWF